MFVTNLATGSNIEFTISVEYYNRLCPWIISFQIGILPSPIFASISEILTIVPSSLCFAEIQALNLPSRTLLCLLSFFSYEYIDFMLKVLFPMTIFEFLAKFENIRILTNPITRSCRRISQLGIIWRVIDLNRLSRFVCGMHFHRVVGKSNQEVNK